MTALHEATPAQGARVISQRDIDWACRYLARRSRGFTTNAEVTALMRASTDPTDQEAIRILDAVDESRELRAACAAGDACGSLAFIRPMSVLESEGKRFNFDQIANGLGGAPAASTSAGDATHASAPAPRVRHRYGNGVSGRYQRRDEDGHIITGPRAVLILRQSKAKFTANSTYRWEHVWMAYVGNAQIPGSFSTFRRAERAADEALAALGVAPEGLR